MAGKFDVVFLLDQVDHYDFSPAVHQCCPDALIIKFGEQVTVDEYVNQVRLSLKKISPPHTICTCTRNSTSDTWRHYGYTGANVAEHVKRRKHILSCNGGID